MPKQLDDNQPVTVGVLKDILAAQFGEERKYYRELLRAELRPIKDELAALKAKVDRLIKTEDEDVRAVIKDVKKLERRITALERLR